jgi:queuine tRNA-ribosyltransferase
MALAPLPESRYRFDLRRVEFARDRGPLVEGCPCPACGQHTRAYLHYLAREQELTAARLLSLHNLTYLERLVRHAREAIATGRYLDYRAAATSGQPPWDG